MLGWLAFLRHEGVPTRLLDVTWSPFIAAFFAVASEYDAADGAVWGFSQFQLANGLHTALVNTEKPFFAAGGGALIDGYQPPTFERITPERARITAQDIRIGSPLLLLELATQGMLALHGVVLLEPSRWMSPRHDAQQGAFLAPLNLRSSFQRNLEETVGEAIPPLPTDRDMQCFPQDDKCVSTIIMNAAVIKLRIRAKAKPALRALLQRMNVRGSVLFPDRHGFAMGLRSLLPPKGTWSP